MPSPKRKGSRPSRLRSGVGVTMIPCVRVYRFAGGGSSTSALLQLGFRGRNIVEMISETILPGDFCEPLGMLKSIPREEHKYATV